jgi:DNA-binding response OmpR family regulator
MRILVVEDDRKVASFIRQGLEEEGHTVDAAADGDAALDLLLGADPYDLIVLDVMLPKRDGFAVLKAARQSGVLSPVIMLTARDSVADKVTGLDLGADDYLAKPFAFDELLARVRALFRRGSGGEPPCSTGRPDARSCHAQGGAGWAADRAHHAEWALLECFGAMPGAFSRPMLVQHCELDFDPRATSSTCTSAISAARSTARRSRSSSTRFAERATA